MEYVLFNDVKLLIKTLKEEKESENLRNSLARVYIQDEIKNAKMTIIRRMGSYFRTLDERTLESLIITFNNIQLFSNNEDKEYYEIVKAIAFGAKADVKFEREANKYR